MTIQDLKKWHKSREEEDVWWIQIEGETLGRKVNLEKIEQILDKKFDSEVMVLHVSQAAQRPRPWVEVERVKAAPAEKPHDGKETTGAYLGEREPRPPQNVNIYPSQGNPVQTPVSDASLPSVLPPPPAPPAQRKKKPKKGGVGGVLTTIVIFGLITILARTCGSKVGGDLARKHSAERGRENTYSGTPTNNSEDDVSLRQFVKLANVGLPKMSSRSTRLDSVALRNGNTIVQVSTIITHAKNELDVSALTSVQNQKIKSEYRSAKAKVMRDNNVVWAWEYYDKNGEFLFTVSSSP
ncbi:hypothetical protein N8632_01120 [bacterium]|nr:hypothetical protein [bacterium]